MKTFITILTLLLSSFVCHGQQNPLVGFEALFGKTWLAEGTWGDGSAFRQEVTFEYSLGQQLIIAKSKGYTDQAQTTFRARNHGIRKYDSETKKILFWEFDIFGGVTTGEVLLEGKNITYKYEYESTTLLDTWTYINDSTYSFTVSRWDGGNATNTYLETEFKVKQ